jgi:hypothetical protein
MTIAVFSPGPGFMPAACLLVICAASAASNLAVADAVPQPLGVEDVMTMRIFQIYAPIMLSADGSRNHGRAAGKVSEEADLFPECSAKFWLEPVGLARNMGFTGRELKRIGIIIESNRTFLLEAWHGYFGT